MRRVLVVAGLLAIAVALVIGWKWRHRSAPGSATAAPTTETIDPRSHRPLRPLRLSDAHVQPAAEPSAPFSLEGRVLSTGNLQPIPGAVVTFGSGGATSEVSTDGEGRFAWSTTKMGAQQLVSISARGFVVFQPELDHSPVLFTARPGVRLTEITLFLTPDEGKPLDGGVAHDEDAHDAGPADEGPRGRVTGSVKDAAGKPVVAFSIVAQVKKGAMQRSDEQSSAFFDAEGNYAFDELRAGSQCLTAVAFGHAASQERCVEVPAGGEARVDFQLGRGAKLTGRITDRQSKNPIQRARVSLESGFGGEDLPLPVISAGETNADGRFELGGLSTGTRSIFVTAAGHHHRVVPGIQLDADRPPPFVEIDLLATEKGEEQRIESAGINAAVKAEGDHLVITGVSPGGGAAEAGLQAGDVLVKVDGVALASLGNMMAGIEKLRGPEGSTVVVSIQRPPAEGLRDVTVTRRRVINR
jgi:hypothetical protein